MSEESSTYTAADATVLAQLLLMQSVLCGLPTEASIFAFACRGLSFIPGVTQATCDHGAIEPASPGAAVMPFQLTAGSRTWGHLLLEVKSPAAFERYVPFIRNFAAMVALILDDRLHRTEGEKLQAELERRVAERTAQLTAEVAERRDVEAQLQRSRDLLARTLDAVPHPVFWKGLDGCYLGCNRAFVSFVGLGSPDAVLGRRDQEMPWRAEDISGYRNCDAEVARTGQPLRAIPEKLRSAAGTLHEIETTKVPLIDAAGKVYGVLGLFEDVTERNRAQREKEHLQAQLAQAQKMESVGRLAGGVAHDFNNMLQAILGNASLALVAGNVPPLIAEHLEEILKAAERSAMLTQQLLAFARKQTVAPKVLDLNLVVASMLKMLHRLIGENVQLSWNPAEPLWPVRVDPIQIDQVLANLVVNARDAITGNGEIRIATGMVTLANPLRLNRAEDLPPGEYVTLTVTDTGCGLSAETRAHLFEPFYTTKPAGKGTGLGLATVYGIARQNRGTVTVESGTGTGTSFCLYLPRAHGSVASPPTTSTPLREQRTETLLVVEDEEQILTLTQRVLQMQGYSVLVASTPETAIRIAEQHPGPIHLLITDVIMPGMSGGELFGHIARLKPGMRCIFMSGYTADMLGPEMRQTINAFQAKPFTPAELNERVRLTLEAPPPPAAGT